MNKYHDGKTNTPPNCVVFNIQDNEFKNQFDYFFEFDCHDERLRMLNGKPFSVCNDNLLCLVPLGNTIYKFENNQMKPAYFVDFGKYNLTENDKALGVPYVWSQTFAMLKAGSLEYINETDDFIFFSYLFGTNLSAIYDKETKETAIFEDILQKANLPKLSSIQAMLVS